MPHAAAPDPASNFTLRLAIDRARAENMPKDNIEKAIRRGAGLDKDAAEIEEVMYEGYGPHGVAILIQCLTDNRNRTIADVRRAFNRGNGNLGEPNSVAWQFTETGYILFNLFDDNGEPRDLDPDEIAMAAIEADAVGRRHQRRRGGGLHGAQYLRTGACRRLTRPVSRPTSPA